MLVPAATEAAGILIEVHRMKNTFSVEIKKDGVFQAVDGTVFPLTWSDLLDERLDEAYITLYKSTEKAYKPLTEVRIILRNGKTTVDTLYFIVASDNATEYPIGSGKYKHKLYLIERTKILEGVLCQTITFTNAKGKVYTNAARPVKPEWGNNWIFPVKDTAEYKSPVVLGENINVYSAKKFGSSLDFSAYDAMSFSVNETSYVTVNGKDYKYDETPAALAETINVISYNMSINGSSSLTGSVTQITTTATYTIIGVQNRYPTKKNTITYVVNRILELAEPVFKDSSGEYVKAPRFTFNKEQAEKYDNVLAPDFSMTQCTLREQLKVVGGYIHAEPYLDEKDQIWFLEYGSTKGRKLAGKNVYNSASIDINQYCTEIRTNAQNLVNSLDYAAGVIIDPASGFSRSLRTEAMYTRISDQNGIVQTQFPIYSVQSLKCGITKYGEKQAWLPLTDITDYLFEQTEYNAVLSNYSGEYPNSKQYAVYYTQGAKNIGGLFFKAPSILGAYGEHFAITYILEKAQDDKKLDEIAAEIEKGNVGYLTFQVTYKPIFSAFLSHGKQLHINGEAEFSQIYNQSENLIETQYFGENMKGVAARLGNIEQERTYILQNYSDIPAVGDMVDDYAVSAVNVEFQPTYIKVTVGLTKDFNRISQYVGVSSVKRMYEISERDTYRRNVLIKEKVIFSNVYDSNAVGGTILKNTEPITNVFSPSTVISNKTRISSAYVTCTDKKSADIKRFSLPAVGCAEGNTVSLNFAFKDNYSAGDMVQYIPKVDSDNNETQKNDAVSGFWQNDVPYTDYYGKVYYMQFAFVSLITGELSVKFPFDTPKTETDEEDYYMPVYTKDKYVVRKDSREELSVNYEFEIKTDLPDLIIGSALASYCSLIREIPYSHVEIYDIKDPFINIGKFQKTIPTVKIVNPNFPLGYYYEAAPGFIRMMDKDNKNTLKVEVINNNGATYITADYKKFSDQGHGWVIATPISQSVEKVEDEDGNITEQVTVTGGEILLASNRPIQDFVQNGEFRIYCYATKQKERIYNPWKNK